MAIGKFCNRNVVCALRGTTVAEAAQLMRRNHVGNLVVVDEADDGRRPVGIVTDRDIVVEIVAMGLDPCLVKLGDLLLRPLITVAEGTRYAETVRLMSTHGVRRVPVVDDAGLLVGIIALDDLLRQLAVPLAELSELTLRERSHEFQMRSQALPLRPSPSGD